MDSAKVYLPEVTAQEMSIDGWSRGFDIEQTLKEMGNMGVDITREQIELHWSRLEQGYKAH